MLIGEYRTKINEKKRIAVPKKFRDELGKELIITRGYENTLVLVDKDRWDRITGDVTNGSFINKNIRDISRYLIGSAIEVNPDPQGRVVISDALCEHAFLENDVIFIGLGNWIEIWDRKKWDEKINSLSGEIDDISAELTKVND